MVSDANVKIQRGKLLQLVYIGMNAKHAPLDKVRVREASRTAIDYDGIVRSLLRGEARKVQTIIPEGLFGFNASAPFQANAARAKALLKEAGVGGGFSVELLHGALKCPRERRDCRRQFPHRPPCPWGRITVKIKE